MRDFCVQGDPRATLANVADYLGEFTWDKTYLPVTRQEEAKLAPHYPFLRKLWNALAHGSRELRGSTFQNPNGRITPVAVTNEYDFINKEMTNNPWAKLRLGYLAALDELENFRNDRRRFDGLTTESAPVVDNFYEFNRNIDSIVSKLEEAAAVIGIDRPLKPNYANDLLTRAEKLTLWKEFVQDIDRKSLSLLDAKLNDRSLYDHLTDLSYQTLLTEEEAETYIEEHVGPLMDDEGRRALVVAARSEEVQTGRFLLDLYNMRGNPEAQARHFEDYTSRHRELRLNEYNIQNEFLKADFALKTPIYSSLVRRASFQKREQFLRSLELLCALNLEDHEGLRALFYGTIASTEEGTNALGGFQDGVPQEVLDKMGEMHPDEWTMLKWVGVMMASIFTIGFSGMVCTGVPILCPPLAASLTLLGPTALVSQAAMIHLERRMYLMGGYYEPIVQNLEDVGIGGDYDQADGWFTKDASDQLHRTPLWFALEVTLAPNILGFFGRGLNYGARFGHKAIQLTRRSIPPRAAWIEAYQEAARLQGPLRKRWNIISRMLRYHIVPKSEWSREFQAVLDKAEVRLASYILFPRNYTSEALVRSAAADRRAFDAIGEQLNPLEAAYRQGRLSLEAFEERARRIVGNVWHSLNPGLTGDTIVEQPVREIDAATARRVADYLQNDPEYMLRLVKDYSGRRLDKAENSIANVGRRLRERRRLPNFRYYAGGDVLRSWWSTHLAENGGKLRTLVSDLEDFVARGETDIEGFILEYIDEMTSIFIDVAMRPRELPYMATLQGGYYYLLPHIRHSPRALGPVSDGIIVRQFFQSRARLAYESYKRQARTEFDLPAYISEHSNAKKIRAFMKTFKNAFQARRANHADDLAEAQKTARPGGGSTPSPGDPHPERGDGTNTNAETIRHPPNEGDPTRSKQERHPGRRRPQADALFPTERRGYRLGRRLLGDRQKSRQLLGQGRYALATENRKRQGAGPRDPPTIERPRR